MKTGTRSFLGPVLPVFIIELMVARRLAWLPPVSCPAKVSEEAPEAPGEAVCSRLLGSRARSLFMSCLSPHHHPPLSPEPKETPRTQVQAC